MNKTKVAFFTESLYGGGVERILQIICANFDYNKYDVTIYSMRKDTPSHKYFPQNIKFKYIFDTLDKKSFIKQLICKIKNKFKLLVYYHTNPSFFYNLFIKEKADVAIAFIEGYATRIVSGFPNKTKKIAWLHIEIENFHWSEVAYRSLEEEKKAYQSMNQIVCVSNIVKQQIDHLFSVEDKSIVIYNPIDRSKIISASNLPLTHKTRQKDCLQLISIGTLNERKGHIRLLRVFNQLVQEGYNIHLWILGSGEMYNVLNSFIEEHHLQARVSLLGFQDNPYNYLKSSDIYICSSYAEGYNTAITESLVLGIPVISTECSGVKEQLGENNEWGICVPNNEKGLYEGLKKMLNKDKLDYYKKQASLRGEVFSVQKSMNEIYSIINS